MNESETNASLASLRARLKKEPIAFQAETQMPREQPSTETGRDLREIKAQADAGYVANGCAYCLGIRNLALDILSRSESEAPSKFYRRLSHEHE